MGVQGGLRAAAFVARGHSVQRTAARVAWVVTFFQRYSVPGTRGLARHAFRVVGFAGKVMRFAVSFVDFSFVNTVTTSTTGLG